VDGIEGLVDDIRKEVAGQGEKITRLELTHR
jgi:hypothetical protein